MHIVALLMSISLVSAVSADTRFDLTNLSLWETSEADSREYEVHKYVVTWYAMAPGENKLYSRASYDLPFPRQLIWDEAIKYEQVAKSARGVKRLDVLYEDEHKQVVELAIKVLWTDWVFQFEIEREAPRTMTFRVDHPKLGQCRGYSEFTEKGKVGASEMAQTHVELVMSLEPAVSVPDNMVLMIQKMIVLRGLRSFFELCEVAAR